MSDDDELLREYAGENYAEPVSVVVASVDFDDYDDLDIFIEALTSLKAHPNTTISWDKRKENYRTYTTGVKATKTETPDEVAVRVEGYRQRALHYTAERRKWYEQMKREFKGK